MNRLLLDTHAVLWIFDRPQLLSAAALKAVGDPTNRVFVSPISAYELALKHRLGKLNEAGPLLDVLADWMRDEDFERMPVTHEHALMAGRLDLRHRDPFDRLLMAQALVEGLALVSNEELFELFGVPRVW